MERFTLNNGTTIPALGIGTFLMEPDDAQAAVTSALQSGYSKCLSERKSSGKSDPKCRRFPR